MYSSKTQQQYNTNTQRDEKNMQIKPLTTKCSLQLFIQTDSYKNNISTILAEAIQESFSSLVKSQKYDIFHYLEKEYSITKENIPKNIEKFVNILEDQFGPGAKLIEIKIIELIHKKIQNFGHTPKNHDLFLKEYLCSLFSAI
jgi:hypothetical protein